MTHHDESERLTAAIVTAAELGPGYETRDTNVWAIVLFLIGLFVTLFLVQVALWLMLKELVAESGFATIPAVEATPPPAFQYPMTSALHQQLETLHESEERTLNMTTWIDSDKKVVQLRLDQAINAISERGIPAYAGKPQTESMVNSHSGVAQPMDEKGKLKADDKAKPDGGAK